MRKDLSRKVAAKIALQIFDVEYAKMTKRMVPRTPRKALVGLCETSTSRGWKGTESTGCRSFGYLFYLLSLDLGKEPIHCTNDHDATAALHPFQPHGMPLFASTWNCTINIGLWT